MSAAVAVTVQCDAPGCPAYISTSRAEASAAVVRLELVSRGWDYYEGDDYCPSHRPRRGDR